jgi:hypothetical protein
MSRSRWALILLLLVSPAWAAATRCTTYEEQTLGRLQTLCDNGARGISTYNRTLERWDTTITASPKQSCTEQMHSKTRQVEVRCR